MGFYLQDKWSLVAFVSLSADARTMSVTIPTAPLFRTVSRHNIGKTIGPSPEGSAPPMSSKTALSLRSLFDILLAVLTLAPTPLKPTKGELKEIGVKIRAAGRGFQPYPFRF